MELASIKWLHRMQKQKWVSENLKRRATGLIERPQRLSYYDRHKYHDLSTNAEEKRRIIEMSKLCFGFKDRSVKVVLFDQKDTQAEKRIQGGVE